ncbi:MAG TPA: hypothetical protein PKA55_11025 [Rhodoblastus sp.]|nr:hypothetical protein [Rhodoblastus sp.]
MKPKLRIGIASAIALLGTDVAFAADNSGSAGTSAPPPAKFSGQSEPRVPKGPQHTNMPAARDDMSPTGDKGKDSSVPQGMPGVSGDAPGKGR